MKRRFSGGGFTLIELLAVVVALMVAAIVLLPAFATRSHCGGSQMKDATQVRGVHQGFISWAQNNADHYPLPSLIDKSNATVADEGAAKDHTASILSPLIFNGTVSPEIFINPAEASGNIKLYDDYQFDAPKTAVDPTHALWDPAFSSDFTAKTPGNNSYAHIIPSGARAGRWTNTFSPSEAVIGNRGPQVLGVSQRNSSSVTPAFAIPDSITFLIHGSRTKWEGNVAFNDNHVEFITQVKAGTYTDAAGKPREDVLFFDEPDDAAGTNAFLGVFTKAGPTPSSFKSIWD